jgi:hypothetical protein
VCNGNKNEDHRHVLIHTESVPGSSGEEGNVANLTSPVSSGITAERNLVRRVTLLLSLSLSVSGNRLS